MSGRLSPAVLAVGIVLTTATQLRAAVVPVGPGELTLLGWVAFTLATWWARPTARPRLEGAFLAMSAFWTVALLATAGGALIAIALRRFEPLAALHDVAAFVLVATISIVAAGQMQVARFAEATARWLVFSTASCGLLLLTLAFTIREIGPVDLWYYAFRFQGWSENPNQQALLFVAAPFLAMALSANAQPGARRWIFASIAVGLAGLATLSDALILAWCIGGGCLLLIVWLRKLFTVNTSAASVLLYGLILPIGVCGAAVLYADAVASLVSSFAQATYSEGGQGITRLNLWSHALQALAQSPIVGWGPGPHAGAAAAHDGMEAHNIFLDWGASTGIVGLGALLSLLCVVLLVAASSRQTELFAVAGSLLLFGMFHYVMRQPLFWLYLLLVAELSRSRSVLVSRRTDDSACAAS